ncbi:AmmeMemoRadiSam system protein B [Patescibacteria group bacterium]|nr:MAG: AmmeMemoRadiSam system protein B [Patescibacteria group bacterium]
MVLLKQITMSFLVLVFFGLGILFASDEPEPNWFENTTNHFSYDLALPSLYEAANATAQSIDRTGARSGIIAHHLLVGDKIAQTISALGNGREKTVVIISPNHFNLGRSVMQTTDGTWKTPFGDVEVDVDVLEELLGTEGQGGSAPDLWYEPETFKQEHGISAIVPFVKVWFPRARIVPIVVHDDATSQQLVDLARSIQSAAPRAVVLASIDMSHNLPAHIQTVHDEMTMRTIENGNCADTSCNLEIDSNAALETLFTINALRETQAWHLMHHGSSLAMGATDDWWENTSHILGYFERGKPIDEPFLSIQFVGDVMLDRGVRSKMELQDVEYPWKEVQRYLQGAHLRVANLEGTISEEASMATEEPPFRFTFAPEFVEALKPFIDVVSLANNHSRDRDLEGEAVTQQWLDTLEIDWFGGYATAEPVYRTGRVSIVGYHQFGTSLDEVEAVIQQEELAGQFVIVFPHWGVEYVSVPQDGQRELAKRMIQTGADLIIGSHPHVIQGIEMIESVPIIYSLGNFVFDQVEPGTDMGMSATVLLDDLGGTIYLSPVATINGQPTPLSDDQAHLIFQNIASLSSENLESRILTGIIPFSYD